MSTPIKTVRIPPSLREAIRIEAQKQGSNESDIIRRALREHLRIQPQPKEKAQ